MHPHEHGAPGSAGQGRLHPRGHRHGEPFEGGGHGGGDEPEWRLRHSRAGLCGRKRLHQGRENHPELHLRGQQDGVAEGLNARQPIAGVQRV